MGPTDLQLKRSSLTVPGDQPMQVTGAARFGAAQIVVDLADVEPSNKDVARAGVAEALAANDYGDALVAVQINPVDSMWAYRDVVDIVEQAGEFLDGIAVGQVTSPADLEFVDTLVGMIEQRIDLGHQIDLEAEISTVQALALLDDVAVVSDRLDALVLDEAGVLAALGADDGSVPSSPDVLAPVRLQVLVVARAFGLQAITVPAVDGTDTAAFRAALERARTLGYDGARCTHPVHVDVANDVFGSL